MRKSSQQLHSLIKSLNPSEKRYFHGFAQRHVIGEENQYLTLFQAIDRLTEWDEEALREKLGNQSQADYLPVAKHQLYQQVLDSLHQFHRQHHPPVRVQQWLHQAELLTTRGLMSQADKLLQKAHKAALDREDQTLLLSVLRARQRYLTRRGLAQVNPHELEALIQAETNCLTALQQEHQLWAWSAQLFRQHATQANDTELSEFLEEEVEPLSFQAELAYHQARGTWHYLRGEMEQALTANQTRLDAFYQRPQRIRHYPGPYLSTLNNYLVDCLRLGRHDEMQQPMSTARALIDQPAYRKVPRLAMDVFRLTYLIELNLRLNQRDYPAANAIIPTVEAGLKRYQAQLPLLNLLTFHYLLAYIAFQQNGWRVSLRRLQPLLNHPKRNQFPALTQAALLLQLLIHYELGDQDLLAHLLRRYERQLPEAYTFLGKALVRTLRQVTATPERAVQRQTWEALAKELTDTPQTGLLQYVDVGEWVNQQLTSRLDKRNKE